MPQRGGLKVTTDKKGAGGILPSDRTAVICGSDGGGGGAILSGRDAASGEFKEEGSSPPSPRSFSLGSCFPTQFFPFQFLSFHGWELS